MANVDTDKLRMGVPNPSTGQIEPTGDLFRLMDHRFGDPNVNNDIGKVPAYVGSHYFEWQKRAIIATGTATAETSGTAAQNGYGRLDIPSSVLQHEGWMQIRYNYTPSQSFYFAFSGENGYSPLRYHGAILNADDAGIIRSGDLVTVFCEQVTIGNTTGFYFHLVGVDRKERWDEMLGDGAFYPNAIQDNDGNWYGAVIIGKQVWMAENLRTTHYSDGTAISFGDTDYSESTPYYYHAKGNADNDKEYGLLYNLPAVMNGAAESDTNPSGVQGIAPSGWHVPSNAEWEQLRSYVSKQPKFLSDGETASKVVKAMSAVTTWPTSSYDYAPGNNPSLNNRTGFGAKTAGGMSVTTSNNLEPDGYNSALFISTSLYGSDSSKVWQIRNSSGEWLVFGRKFTNAHSVRCVCDMTPFQFREWYIRTYGSLQHRLQADWEENNNKSDGYIRNRPGLHDGYYFPNAVQDFDGNWYGAVVIGNKVWLAENLRTKHYSDGTAITGTTPGTWSNDTPYWIYPNNVAANAGKYGLLYNWPAIMNGASGTNSNPSNIQGISPTGFHVPSESELEEMLSYLNAQKKYLSDGVTPGRISKALASSSGWDSSSEDYSIGCNKDENNKTGFGMKGAGYCTSGFFELNKRCILATCTNQSTIGYRSKRFYHDSPTYTSNYEYSYLYSSVRCVSNLTPEQFRAWYVDTYGTMQHHVDPLLTMGERLMINSDGSHTIDLTNRSVTVVNFAAGVTDVVINFKLDALGDRQVIFKRAADSSNVLVKINSINSGMSNRTLTLITSNQHTINTNFPRHCVISNRIAEDDICVLTSSSISATSAFGNSSGTPWTPEQQS